jgi:hypothetical protein
VIPHIYMILSEQDRSILRMERVRALEADLCRAELNYEDALSTEERTSVAGDIQAFQARLKVHYRVLGITEEAEGDSP